MLCAEGNLPPPLVKPLHSIIIEPTQIQEVHVERVTLNDGRFYECDFV